MRAGHRGDSVKRRLDQDVGAVEEDVRRIRCALTAQLFRRHLELPIKSERAVGAIGVGEADRFDD